MLENGVSRLQKFMEAEEKRGFLWNLIDPPVDPPKISAINPGAIQSSPEPQRTGVVQDDEQGSMTSEGIQS